MLSIRELYSLNKQKEKTMLTIGNFDGVHLGHQAIIQQMVEQSAKQSLSTVVVIFEPQPKEYFMQENAPRRIMPLHEKVTCLKSLGVNQVVCLDFNAHLASLSPEDFVKKILIERLEASWVCVGEDFRFGYQQQGDVLLLKKWGEMAGFEVTLIPSVNVEGVMAINPFKKISSTLIRALLQQGHMEEAACLLGRPFRLSGRVVRGDRRGCGLGFPTANIHCNKNTVLPFGVYAVKIVAPELLYGVANWGSRPTFQGVDTVLEVHIFDFKGDLYGQCLSVDFIHRLREEKRFESVDALKQQIAQDVLQAKRYFGIAN